MSEHEYEKQVTIREMKQFFDFQQVTGNEESLDRWVIVPDVNRPGLELTGFYERSEPKRIVVLGAKEMAYIRTLNEETQWERFDVLTDPYTPAIVICKNYEPPVILRELALRKNFPIFTTPEPTYRVMVDIISFLDEQLAPSDTLHGVLMSVYGKGVLILGESGMGKSETALELIRKGHVLIADDRVDVSRVHNQIFGQAPDVLKGVLEVRGIGIIDIVKMFGASSILNRIAVDVAIHLEPYDKSEEYERVGMDSNYVEILGIAIPQIIFPVKEGRNMAVLIESAVTNFTLKERGFDGAFEFEQRVVNLIEDQKENQS
ncbi:MAG: HPr(Ser) kinase/phosphatase [Erysipelotrichaceae bacterium]|jgi:HPr kinase/phosphorylase|nr:HPr(Ser) kinase/phosphatase [Erysipelotrichaceae bacterium]